jgi:hypothetical protein
MDENHNPRQLCETNVTPTQASGPMTPTVSIVPLFLSRSPRVLWPNLFQVGFSFSTARDLQFIFV